MLSKSRTRWTLVIGLLLVLVLAGCQQAFDAGSSEESGDVSLSMDLSGSAVSVDSVEVTLTHGASGQVVSDSLTVDSADSTASGTISDLVAGSWSIEVTLLSEGSTVGTGSGTATVTAGETASATVTITVEEGGTGTLEGTIRDATTGNGLGGVTVAVEGTENTTTSASDGSFTITAPSGDQTLTFSLEGYSFPEIDVEVTAGQTVELNEGRTVASPNVGSGNVRIVLTWGENPRDLDSHLLTPSGEEVYWVNTDPPEAGANLDRDDVSSYGPETITITEPQLGTYQYWVYQYSSTGSLTSSEAVVELYDSTGLFKAYTVPTSGSGRYWHVVTMEYDGSQFLVTDVDQIQSTEPSS